MSDLQKLALKLGTDGPFKTLATPREVKLLFNGVYIIRTTKAIFVWEHPFYPQLYIPHAELAHADQRLEHSRGEEWKNEAGNVIATQYILTVGPRTISKNILFASTALPAPAQALQGLLKIDFASVDQWFEEDTPIFVHPKDPFKRIDILASTRPIVVRVGDQVVAQAASAMHLYETGLPVRFYLPFTSLDPAVLRPSSTRTKCPYKGEAEYYSVEVAGTMHEDVVWYYRTPLLESAKVEGLCCFYNEKVEIELDGKVLEKPITHFSKQPGKAPSAVLE